MKQQTEQSAEKQKLCQELERIQKEINQLALSLSICQTNDAQEIWLSLANARAHLTNAVEAAQRLKNDSAIQPPVWVI